MTTGLVLLGTAGAPLPRGRPRRDLIGAGHRRTRLRLDCGRGSPSAFVGTGLDFTRLEAVFLTHLHAEHIGDLARMILYPWGVRENEDGPLPPIRVYGPSRPGGVPEGDALFHRETTIYPERPTPSAPDLVESILAGRLRRVFATPR